MKKIIIFFVIILIIVSTVAYIYLNYKAKYNEAQKENAKFEDIKEEQEITGQDLVSIMNRIIDLNEKNAISKDDKGYYIDNEKNSVNMDVTFKDVEVTYNIERINKAGMSNFLQNYRDIIFKCIKIQYHEATGKIKYIHVEQYTE